MLIASNPEAEVGEQQQDRDGVPEHRRRGHLGGWGGPNKRSQTGACLNSIRFCPLLNWTCRGPGPQTERVTFHPSASRLGK